MISSLQFGQNLDFIGLGDRCDDTRVVRRGEELILLQSRTGYCVAATRMNAASGTMAHLKEAISDGV